MSYEEIWKKAAKEVAKERDCPNDKLNQAYEDGYQMEGKYRDMKIQRDTLIDDIAVLRANNERLERELEIINKHENGLVSTIKLKDELLKESGEKIAELERENEKLRNESIKNYKLWEESEEQERYFVKEFNKYHNLYTTLIDHIRDMKFASPYSYNYIHLVNFIKELERADDEK